MKILFLKKHFRSGFVYIFGFIRFRFIIRVLNILYILDQKQIQIKHKQVNLRGSPKPSTIHGDSRLYIIEGMIQTLNSTQYNPIKPSVSLLHSVFLSNLYFSLSQLHSLALTTLPLFSALDTSFFSIISLHSLVFVFIGEGDSLVVEKKGEWLIVVVERRGWLRKNVDNCYKSPPWQDFSIQSS